MYRLLVTTDEVSECNRRSLLQLQKTGSIQIRLWPKFVGMPRTIELTAVDKIGEDFLVEFGSTLEA